MISNNRWARVLIPGMVFQSVITGGGFATGREVVEYFAKFGASAPLALVTAGVGFALLFFSSAETAREHRAYNYDRFGRAVLRKAWPLLEVTFLAMAVLVCAVVIAAFTETLQAVVAVPAIVGTALATLITVLLIAIGRTAVLASKLIGAALLTGSYAWIALHISSTPMTIVSQGLLDAGDQGWLISAGLYVAYNSVAYLTILYSLEGLRSRGESMGASLVAGVLILLPLLAVWYSIAAFGTAFMTSPTPLHEAARRAGGAGTLTVYYVALFWTLLDTIVGITYAVVDRVESARGLRAPSMMFRGAVTAAFVLASIGFARFGMIPLVARGYSAMAYAFLAVLVIPVVLSSIGRGRSTNRQAQHF